MTVCVYTVCEWESRVSWAYVSGHGVFTGVIGSYEAVHVYQADTFIYTHLVFPFSSIYRLVAMVSSFLPQVQGIYSMLEATFHKFASVFTYFLFLF